ncbi:MAG: DUF192 domain-containing protein [bacterium]|nr:DUF192 domain-containing protein [bacterium]
MKLNKLQLFTNLYTSLFVLFILLFFGLVIVELKSSNLNKVLVKNQVFIVDLAKNSSEWRQGLSGRDKLAENEAMLFIFPDYRQPHFWMKDMNFSLDILWIKDTEIVDFDENLSPLPKNGDILGAEKFSPDSLVNKVLEVPAGTVDRLNIQKGDIIKPII